MNKTHANLAAKTLQRTYSIQIKLPCANLVSDIVSGVKKVIQPVLESLSYPSSIYSFSLEFPDDLYFVPTQSTIQSPASEFPN